MRKILSTGLVAAAFMAPAVLGMAPASAGPGGCVASDPADVTVNSRTNTVTIKDDPTTGGNNFGCYTNLAVTAGETITFSHTAVCGGGVPRLYVSFAGGASENTFDTGTCAAGTVTYTLVNSGKIKSFALINDRGDSGTVTYSDLVIAGKVINF